MHIEALYSITMVVICPRVYGCGGGEGGGGYNVLTPQRVHPNQPQYNQCMLKISIICNKFFFASHAVNCN